MYWCVQAAVALFQRLEQGNCSLQPHYNRNNGCVRLYYPQKTNQLTINTYSTGGTSNSGQKHRILSAKFWGAGEIGKTRPNIPQTPQKQNLIPAKSVQHLTRLTAGVLDVLIPTKDKSTHHIRFDRSLPINYCSEHPKHNNNRKCVTFLYQGNTTRRTHRRTTTQTTHTTPHLKHALVSLQPLRHLICQRHDPLETLSHPQSL